MSRTAQDIIEIGRELNAVKERLHSQGDGFYKWIDREFRMSQRAARRFMSVANRFGNEPGYVAGLSSVSEHVLYLLAEETPEEVRTEVADRIAAGETVTVAEVRALREGPGSRSD